MQLWNVSASNRRRSRLRHAVGGQQQRVAIARALMQSPKMVLADEPIASLDPLNAKIVMDALRDINEREGITVITNLHTWIPRAITASASSAWRVPGGVRWRPSELTADAVHEIYGADRHGAGIDETMTSTSINIAHQDNDAARKIPSPGLRPLAAAEA